MLEDDPFVELKEERRYNIDIIRMEAVSIKTGDLGFWGLFF